MPEPGTPDITPLLMFAGSAEQALELYVEVLSKDGQIMMPLAEYPFSKKFAWVQDRFGVSWQLSAS